MMRRSRLLETDGFNQLARTRNGYCLYNTNDIYVGQSVEKYGEFSQLEASLLEQLLQAGDIVIEVGANIGAHTVGMAKRVGAAGRVLAFEPQRLVFQDLCANIALNSLTNVDCYWAACGKASGSIVVPELDPGQRNNFGGLSLENGRTGRNVQCYALDDFMALPKVKLVKIDVEGMEALVIQGGMRLIAKFKPVLYVENDRVEKSDALIRLIAALGYRMYWHKPPLFNPDNYYADAEDRFPGIVSVNLVCAHRDVPLDFAGLDEVAGAAPSEPLPQDSAQPQRSKGPRWF